MPRVGETSEDSNAPSLDAMAFVKDVIKSRGRGSLQKAGGVVVCVETGVCVSVGMGVNVEAKVIAVWGVSVIRTVGGGG